MFGGPVTSKSGDAAPDAGNRVAREVDASSEDRVEASTVLRSDLVIRADKFCKRFKTLWAADGFRDYGEQPLQTAPDPAADEASVLTKLLTSKRLPNARDLAADDEDKPLTLLADEPDLGDDRFDVAQLEALIKQRPLVGRMLQLTIDASKC